MGFTRIVEIILEDRQIPRNLFLGILGLLISDILVATYPLQAFAGAILSIVFVFMGED